MYLYLTIIPGFVRCDAVLTPSCSFPAMLTYRQWRCCNHSTIKLVHTLYHIMAIPCIAVGLIAAFDFHNNRKPTPIPNLYSLHSWMGLFTVGLYGLQVLPAVNIYRIVVFCSNK